MLIINVAAQYVQAVPNSTSKYLVNDSNVNIPNKEVKYLSLTIH